MTCLLRNCARRTAEGSPVCGDQLALYNELPTEFSSFDAALLGISVDAVGCYLAFANDRKSAFPLLSDFEPKGDVAKRYGVYREKEGVSERALFVVDDTGPALVLLMVSAFRTATNRARLS